jgi:hypothetical protein
MTTTEICNNHSNVRIRNYGVRMQCSNAPQGTLHAVIDADTVEIVPGEDRQWDISKYNHFAMWYYVWFEWFDGNKWNYVPQGQTFTAKPGYYWTQVGVEFTPGTAEGTTPSVAPLAKTAEFTPSQMKETLI